MKECSSGRHRFDKMLGDRGIAEAARCFVVSALLIADLAEKEEDDGEDSESEDRGRRIRALTDELPEFIRKASHHSHGDEEDADAAGSDKLVAQRLAQDP